MCRDNLVFSGLAPTERATQRASQNFPVGSKSLMVSESQPNQQRQNWYHVVRPEHRLYTFHDQN